MVAFLCAALACSHAVVLSDGYNSDYYDYYNDIFAAQNSDKVLPTVAIPIHAVSAAPLHVDASLDQELHEYKHQADQDNHYDYYVSNNLFHVFFRRAQYSFAS